MIHYILQVILFQLLFLVVYDLFLKKETFFNYNRLYLLGTSILSFVIPFLKFEAIQQTIPQEYRVQLPAILIGNSTSEASLATSVMLDEVVVQQPTFSWTTIVLLLYGLGVLFSIVVFALKLRKLYKLKKLATQESFGNYTVATIPNSEAAFTYLKTVFLGAKISEEQKNYILQHELVHVQQRHTLDLLFFELLRIVFWFNPLVYITQIKLQVLHEYTADRIVASKDKAEYYQSLLQEVFRTTTVSFINTFYKSSIIKNRIVMLQKTNSKKIVQLKYLLIIPAVCAMLFYTSCSNEKSEELSEEANLTMQTDSEVMQKINELSEAIMKKGSISDEEAKALKFLATEANEGDKIYTSVQEYLDDTQKSLLSMKDLTKVPTYPGCSGSNEELKKCMAQGIATFVMENFNQDISKDSKISGKQRIVVMFEIDKNGAVVHPKAKAAHASLEQEAIRVVSKLPKMIPGEHDGKSVGVQYTLPIIFKINE
ncbi:hypothetical protein G5B37_07785 [Rasiella rasia]|uniref:Uncharacterized protein n=1 Tax=Rasiella rasia TaxID=2744027 RepID=A0A6G6GLS5_9FLAO|nr:M56 family metallopeptidase [Rasiella rasia]QIE59467.1 hypothetical protein G5B37_07785 [Rasiella rasia]